MIIGLTGMARCGKNTVANCISAVYGGVEQYALADPLKRAASVMFNIPLEHFHDDEKKDSINDFWGISPREITQKLGTDCARNMFCADFWLKRCESQTNTSTKFFVITDIRFENEADWVRERDGEIWHIERPSLGIGVVRNHVSEAGIVQKDGDIVIMNDGSLGQLYNQIDDSLRDCRWVTKNSDRTH